MAERSDVVPEAMKMIPEKSNYSPGVRVGDMLYIAGQVGRDEQWKPVAGVEAQIAKAWDNVALVLKEAGGSLDDIVDLLTFHTDMSHIAIFHQVKNRYLKSNRPAWTAVGTSALYDPEIIVEIKAVAFLGGNR